MNEATEAIRVLVVEDSKTTRQLLVKVLESDREIKVVGQAENGRQAVDLTRRLNPDLITMDVVMEGMDGLEATRRILAEKTVPILIVTVLNDSDEHNIAFEALNAGALDVISKRSDKDAAWKAEFIDKVKNLARLT